jgi:hypothetical protein
MGEQAQPVGGALLHIQSWITDHVDAFTQWCDSVHHAEALQVPGFLSCRRFERVDGYAYAAPKGADFLTVYQVREPEIVNSDVHNANSAAMTPAPDGVMDGLEFLPTVYRAKFPEHGWMAPDGSLHDEEEPVGAAILHVMMDVEPAYDDELNAWYAEEHLPRLLEVPGMLAGRRFVDSRWPAGGEAEAGGRHQYLAMYELVDPSVVESPEYAQAAEMTPRTAALAPHIGFHSQIYRQVFSLRA